MGRAALPNLLAGVGCSREQEEPEATGPHMEPERVGEATIPGSALVEGLRRART